MTWSQRHSGDNLDQDGSISFILIVQLQRLLVAHHCFCLQISEGCSRGNLSQNDPNAFVSGSSNHCPEVGGHFLNVWRFVLMHYACCKWIAGHAHPLIIMDQFIHLILFPAFLPREDPKWLTLFSTSLEKTKGSLSRRRWSLETERPILHKST